MSADKPKSAWGNAKPSVDELNKMLQDKTLPFTHVRTRAEMILANLDSRRDVKKGLLRRYRKSVRAALEEWAKQIAGE